MIQRLQRKFIIIVITAIALVILILLGSINVLKFQVTARRADEMLELLVENGGRFPDLRRDDAPELSNHPDEPRRAEKRRLPPEVNEDTGFKTRFFIVWLDDSGDAVQVDTGKIASVTAEEAVEYGKRAVSRGSTHGYDGNYRYYRTDGDQQGPMVIFLDCSTELYSNRVFLLLSCGFGAGTFLAVSMLAVVFSRKAIRPVSDAMEKQRSFLADASHELKTPLAIISANNDVMELTNGKGEWTASIRSQISRMDKLLKAMLDLTRLDAGQTRIHPEPLDLSALTRETAESFQLLAQSGNVFMVTRVDPDIRYTGDRMCLQQLLSILLDNGVKYAGEGGTIWVSLQTYGKAPRLTVENTCERMPHGNLDRLFDRFYRCDDSRSRQTGGYGIGLSIARAICEAHGAKISAQATSDRVIRFSVQF